MTSVYGAPCKNPLFQPDGELVGIMRAEHREKILREELRSAKRDNEMLETSYELQAPVYFFWTLPECFGKRKIEKWTGAV